MLKGVEPCVSFDTRGNRETGKLEVVIRERRCLFLYFYYQHKEFGFMHVRIQTWFPFQIQIYINGREWLCKRLDREGIGYQRYDNSIIQVDDVKSAQEIAEGSVDVNFVKAFDALSRQINLVLPRIKKVFSTGYYWVLDQGEYATDVMFKDRQSLTEIYPELVEHALVNFNASDVMTFLGRKLTGNFQGEIITDTKKRPQGVRIKHRMKKNSLKMYDKGSVLRVETTINNPRAFKIYREVERNERYLGALSALEQLAQPVQEGQNRHSGFNPLSPEVTRVFEAVLDGAHSINGFRNKHGTKNKKQGRRNFEGGIKSRCTCQDIPGLHYNIDFSERICCHPGNRRRHFIPLCSDLTHSPYSYLPLNTFSAYGPARLTRDFEVP